MQHIVYPKIKHLDSEETFGILDHYCFVQEKIDGANLSIWKHEGEIYVGSRTQIVGGPTQKTGFRGAVEYCMTHQGILSLLDALGEDFRLYGEWLVRHSIPYPPECYNKFYLFDIYDTVHNTFFSPDAVERLADTYKIARPEILLQGKLTVEQIKEVVGTSKIAKAGEGVVIKAPDFTNKFLNKQHAKMVTENFKEANKLSFGCPAKYDLELNFATTHITIPRLTKIINKIEQNKDETISRKHIAQLLGMMWNDAFTEEIWSYVQKYNKPVLDFRKMEKYCVERTKLLFFDWLENGVLTNHKTDA